MPPSSTSADRIGSSAVHDHRLDGEAVGGDPVHQIADPLPAVKGERQPLQMRVEGAAQIVDHALADPDRRVVVPAGSARRRRDARRRCRCRRAAAATAPAGQQVAERTADGGLAAEHIVDDDLQRPRLQQLEAGDQEDLQPAPRRPASDAASDRAEAWRSSRVPRRSDSAGRGRTRRLTIGARRADPANAARGAIGSTGNQPGLLGDRLDDAVHQPAEADELPADHAEIDEPERHKDRRRGSGAPRIRLPAVSAA